MSRIRERVTYANVVSSLALFIALGGTSYALTLPRNSVGAKQIRTRAVGASEIRKAAVRSNEVRNRSLGIQDLSLSARSRLRGGAGPVGPPGPAGAPAISYRAAINAAGQVRRGNAKVTKPTINEFRVRFPQGVDECVSTATLASVEGAGPTDPPAGRITLGRFAGEVVVRTYDAAGGPQGLPFHLIVAC